ncbi:lipid-binding protein [Chitinophagaceae bacterium 26-R-25]|nr:lipid-binding protein [Chitinophagaceae bacterium 26-R-25]
MKNIRIYILALLAVGGFAGCQKTNDPGQISMQKATGEFWVMLYYNGDEQYPAPLKLSTVNTSTDKDSIWIDQLAEPYIGFQLRAGINMQDLTFASPTNTENLYATSKAKWITNPNTYVPDAATITEGKIMHKAAHSTTGVVTDSIYFKIKFSDDPTTYEMKGTGTTNWPEDDF